MRDPFVIMPRGTAIMLRLLEGVSSLTDFILIGGTALAMHLGHRKSEDLDFITVLLRLPRATLKLQGRVLRPQYGILSFRSALIIGILLVFAGPATQGASEIAVAVRYLQAKGVSHSQIFLYREDGALLRQLTNAKSGQMKGPVFAPDGETIVFTREMPSGGKEYWSVEPKGGNLHKLDTPPPWFTATKDSPYFTDAEADPAAGGATPGPEVPPPSPLILPDGPDHFTTPDGAREVVLKVSGKDDEMDQPGRGRHYELRDLKTGKTVELGNVPGFVGLWGLLHRSDNAKEVFLISTPLHVTFFNLHLNSTDGDTVFALDLAEPRLVTEDTKVQLFQLTDPRLVRLSPNWATPVVLPGEPAFLTLTQVRYVPIDGSTMTANSSYLDHWDEDLTKVRYARNIAAICYGASMYRPGKIPATVNIHSGL